MQVDELINQMDEDGHQWVADEMRLYDDNPELLSTGAFVPNFEHVDPKSDMALAQLYFYVGMSYGVGIANKHDF